MTYDEFRECLMEYLKIPVDVEDMPDDPPSMSLQQAEKLLQEKLYNKFSQVQKAFRSMDEVRTRCDDRDPLATLAAHTHTRTRASLCTCRTNPASCRTMSSVVRCALWV